MFKSKKQGEFTRWLPTILIIVLTVLFITNTAGAKRYYSDPVKSHVSKCVLYNEVSYDNVTIIPVKGPERSIGKNIQTLDDAMKNGDLTVKEVSRSGRVGKLAVWNKSNDYVFIMAGEILAGSKQDRVLRKDVIIPPNSGKVIVDAYCVEKGRWTYKSDKFYSRKRAANISVRQSARVYKSQTAVWGKVNETNRSVAAKTPTDSLQGSFDSVVVKKKRKPFVRRFVNIPSKYPKANGVIVMINGKVLLADMFSDRKIFKKMWPKLYESYIIEGISKKGKSVSSDITSPTRFLKLIGDSTITYVNNPGAGSTVKISSTRIVGSGVVKSRVPIHLEVFPRIDKNEYKPSGRIQRNFDQQRQIENNAPIQ